jgi:phosphatidylserine/phosphatidylglycerophosphate/cardiolipin synthase-like enzyme
MRRPTVLFATLLAATSLAAGTPDRRPTEEVPFRLVLNNPVGRPAPSTKCDVELCTSLLELIEKAESTIDFAIYGIRGQPAIFDALVAAQKRGVTVRGVVDRTVDGVNYYTDTDALVEALGTVRDDLQTDQHTLARQKPYDPSKSLCWMQTPEGYLGPRQCVGFDLGDQCIVGVQATKEELTFQGDIMHNKYFVVDGRYVWMGSTNVSNSGTGGYNANVVGVWNSPVIAKWYADEFRMMWDGQYHRDKRSHRPQSVQLGPDLRVDAWFSPQDQPATRAVRPLLQRARSRIDVGIFFLTHKGIAKDLIDAHRRGVKVRVIMDSTAAKNDYAKHDMVRAAGVPVKVENWGGKMHMKSVAIDGRYIVLGSMNWTGAGERGNDENTLVVKSKGYAKQYHDFYDELWDTIPDKWLKGAPDPESRDSTTSCTDGSDNDFDHLDDAEDPGCGPNPPPLPGLLPFSVVPKAPGHGLLKGTVDEEGGRVYYAPDALSYEKIQVNTGGDDRWFCSTEDAEKAGFARSQQ